MTMAAVLAAWVAASRAASMATVAVEETVSARTPPVRSGVKSQAEAAAIAVGREVEDDLYALSNLFDWNNVFMYAGRCDRLNF